jgi:multicomponent Na+:H+ antiporter subunit F
MTVALPEALLILLALVMVLALVRLTLGPSLPDRVVALDFLAAVAVAASGVWAITTHNPVFLDVGMVLAVISFVGTVAFARYLERRAGR